VFSLALLALELLSGQSSVRSRVSGVVTPRALGLAVSHRMQDLFERALATAPARRPLDARAFLQEMLAAASEPIVPLTPPAAPPGSTDRGRLAPFNPPVPDAIQNGSDAPPPALSAAGHGAAPAPSGQPRLAAPRRLTEESEPWLGFLVGLGVLVLFAGMGGGVLFVLFRAKNPSAPVIVSTGPVASAAAPAPPAVSVGGGASAARTALVPPASGKPAAFPADQGALVPVEADAAVWGDRQALVTMILFGDLTCPFTARQLDQLPALSARFGDQLRVVFKHYPNPASEDAALASEAAAVALSRGKSEVFWRFLDGATRGGRLDQGGLEELGIKAGLAAGVITSGLGSHEQKTAVERDIELGRRLGVRGTPVLFLNGRRYNGFQPSDQLALHLTAEIKKASAELSRGTPPDQLYAARVSRNVTTVDGEK
jgi:protein-disulfide isomerase